MKIEPVIIQRNPSRDPLYHWFATFESYDGPGSPIGHGNTPGEAVDDLFEVADIA